MCSSIPGHTGFILSIIKKNQSTAIILKCAGVRAPNSGDYSFEYSQVETPIDSFINNEGLNLIILAGVTGKTG